MPLISALPSHYWCQSSIGFNPTLAAAAKPQDTLLKEHKDRRELLQGWFPRGKCHRAMLSVPPQEVPCWSLVGPLQPA